MGITSTQLYTYACDKCRLVSTNASDFITELPTMILSSDRDATSTVSFNMRINIAYSPSNYNAVLCKQCMINVLDELKKKIS